MVQILQTPFKMLVWAPMDFVPGKKVGRWTGQLTQAGLSDSNFREAGQSSRKLAQISDLFQTMP